MRLFHLAQKNWGRALQFKTNHKYIEATSYDGGMTRGKKGVPIQQNLKWLRLF